jgi:hypothetical protein
MEQGQAARRQAAAAVKARLIELRQAPIVKLAISATTTGAAAPTRATWLCSIWRWRNRPGKRSMNAATANLKRQSGTRRSMFLVEPEGPGFLRASLARRPEGINPRPCAAGALDGCGYQDGPYVRDSPVL